MKEENEVLLIASIILLITFIAEFIPYLNGLDSEVIILSSLTAFFLVLILTFLIIETKEDIKNEKNY